MRLYFFRDSGGQSIAYVYRIEYLAQQYEERDTPHIVNEEYSHVIHIIATAAFANSALNKYFRRWQF